MGYAIPGRHSRHLWSSDASANETQRQRDLSRPLASAREAQDQPDLLQANAGLAVPVRGRSCNSLHLPIAFAGHGSVHVAELSGANRPPINDGQAWDLSGRDPSSQSCRVWRSTRILHQAVAIIADADFSSMRDAAVGVIAAGAHPKITIPIQVNSSTAGVVMSAAPIQTPIPSNRLRAKATRSSFPMTTHGATQTPTNKAIQSHCTFNSSARDSTANTCGSTRHRCVRRHPRTEDPPRRFVTRPSSVSTISPGRLFPVAPEGDLALRLGLAQYVRATSCLFGMASTADRFGDAPKHCNRSRYMSAMPVDRF